MLADLENETLAGRLAVRAKAIISMLADAEAHVGNEKLGHTIGNVETEALF